MKAKAYLVLLNFLLLAAGLRAAAPAEFKVETVVAAALRDVKNAPAIIALAAGDNPKFLAQITAAALTALPDQSVEIVQTLLEVAPKQYAEIVQAAIHAQPKLSVEITSMALAALPDQSAGIMKAALAAAPPEQRGAINAVAKEKGAETSNPGAGQAPAPTFPSQPINPNLVSPSSS